MIPLRGRAASTDLLEPLARSVWLLVGSVETSPLRQGRAFLVDGPEPVPGGYSLYVGKSGVDKPPSAASFIELPPPLDHLSPGDVLSISSDGQRLRVLW